ncbi:MAG: TRAP transporter small permease subunit [Sphaerochaetaceae bacterium]|nr:TRAP transporter small permease subunit [Sphaerochaetaceae bacterium]MDD3163351.1 TRAP transporter small permease subunit [Sphaerochaetaceae bacterium]MDD4396823.1 TRAP transporter small permease subunit [Sphaerochaetaceae bacterium]
MDLKKAIGIAQKTERIVLLILGIGATLIMFGNAVGRYLFHKTAVWAEEVIRMAFVWGMFIAITDAFITNDHIGFRNLVDKTKVTRMLSDVIYNIVLAFVGFILAFYGGQYNAITGMIPLSGTNWPTALFQIPGIIAGWAWVAIGLTRTVIIIKQYYSTNTNDNTNKEINK